MREKSLDTPFAEDSAEIAPEELREFLEADLSGARIDPKFKEELRQALWEYVRSRANRTDIGGNGG